MNERAQELLELVTKVDEKNKTKAVQLVEEIAFIEKNLRELKKHPFIAVNPKNPAQQKSTPAAKLYKELLQQYNNSLKLLFRLTGDAEADEESPLRKWVKSRGEQ
jgi:hypothetical protein